VKEEATDYRVIALPEAKPQFLAFNVFGQIKYTKIFR
jgi:hypothetical protein